MEFLYVLTTSQTSPTISEKTLGVFDDIELARDAGAWWSADKGYTSDISWSSNDHIETAQVGDITWLHIRTVGTNKLVE